MMNARQNGMIVICGNTIAELEKELEMLKLAISTGATMGCGGSTIGGVEQALKALTSAVGGAPSTPNRRNCASCGGDCDCCCGYDTAEDEYDDEEIEYCPNCGDILNEDGYCENCGYYWEDAEEDDEPSPAELVNKLVETLGDMGELDPVCSAMLRTLAEYLPM